MFVTNFCFAFYVPQTAWIRHAMMQHSKMLGDNWKMDETLLNAIESQKLTETVKYPAYFKRPLHGFKKGGACEYQAFYQSPSMRYIMRLFQGDPMYREKSMTNKLKQIHAQMPNNPNIIDLGCGTGDSTLVVHNYMRNSNLIGVDLSPYMIEIARYNTKLNFLHANAARLSFCKDESIDLITSFAMFHEMPCKYSMCVLKECSRVLKPGGHILIWDQKLTPQSTMSQSCKNVPPVEPFLISYSQLNITKVLEEEATTVKHTEEKFMQLWHAIK